MPKRERTVENRINYHKELQKEMNIWSEQDRCPAILLHCCCAPCSSTCLEVLSPHCRVTAYYYNPNITEKSEYDHRISELERLIREMPMENKADFLGGLYEPELFLDKAKGMEQEPECGRRCVMCYGLRMRRAAEEAKSLGFEYFATTLTLSPLKDAQLINRIGFRLSEQYGVKYLPSDFKKNGGYQRSIELSKEYGLYRQNFCGCDFSKNSDRRVPFGTYDGEILCS